MLHVRYCNYIPLIHQASVKLMLEMVTMQFSTDAACRCTFLGGVSAIRCSRAAGARFHFVNSKRMVYQASSSSRKNLSSYESTTPTKVSVLKRPASRYCRLARLTIVLSSSRFLQSSGCVRQWHQWKHTQWVSAESMSAPGTSRHAWQIVERGTERGPVLTPQEDQGRDGSKDDIIIWPQN